MDFFSDSLARLKHELRVSKDGEVAVALGMSKTAFAERKKRGSFPEKELKNLAETRPELEIDVPYVLTGERQFDDQETQDQFVSRMQAINHMNAVVAALPLNEIGRDRLQALMTGDPAEDGRLIGHALLNRDEIENPIAGLVQTQTQHQDVGTVVPLHVPDRRVLTRNEALALALDTLHELGRTLPSDKLFQVVDLLMAWQRSGAELNAENVRGQLKVVS